MKALLDIPDDVMSRLEQMREQLKISRAELIRQALKQFVQRNQAHSQRDAFGIWKDRKIDSLEYERSLRSEWD